MKKSQIETHHDGHRRAHPAINVKVHRFGVQSSQIAQYFSCTEAIAERALQFAFESAQEQFWEQAHEQAQEIFGMSVRVYSQGRSGGWLALHGLPDLNSWDALLVAKYARLAAWCRAEIDYRVGRDSLLEAIEANEWAKPGAELYNFVETASGNHCIVDLKQQAISAGFGAVIRDLCH